MKTDRRQFIALSASVLATAPMSTLAAGTRNRGFVVVEAGVLESDLFARDYPSQARIMSDLSNPWQVATEIKQVLASGYTVSGCTREAATFVIEELLRNGQATFTKAGRHYRVSATQWRHDDRTNAQAKLFEQSDWPRRLAMTMATSKPNSAQPFDRHFVNFASPSSTTNFVSSWTIVHG